MTKLLVADSRNRADFLIIELELNPEIWLGVGIGDALVGYRFDRIVDLTSRIPVSPCEIEAWREWFGNARSKLTTEIRR